MESDHPTQHPRPTARRGRRLTWSDRRWLERAGWRTLLEYGEDHERGADGVLLAVRRRWIAEAEHVSGTVMVCEVVGDDPEPAWRTLRRDALRHALARTADGKVCQDR